MKWMQCNIAALVVAGALSIGLAGPAAAQRQPQDGLVNVAVGDVTILEDVNIRLRTPYPVQTAASRISLS